MSGDGTETGGDAQGTGPLRLAVTGATGRMGREVIAAAAERGHEVALAVAPGGDAGADRSVDGVAVEALADLPALLADREPDALVDFSAPAGAVAAVEAAAGAGVPVVTGTTGLDDEQLAAVEAAGDRVAVLRAANFSRGIQALERALRAAVAALPEYDVELTETHHSGKVDAPSGTALSLLDALDDARADAAAEAGTAASGERVHGREGEAPRQPGEVGVHARRAGDVAGEHELLLAGNDELLELTHRAGDRGVFAAGALDAAAWLAGRDPGYYDFGAVIDGR